jgi:creatinine amidohydrolase
MMHTMENPSPLFWDALAWPDVPEALGACGQAVLWPIGATEQHGPHLGLGVDTAIAATVSEAVSAATRVPVLPPLPLGVSSGHSKKWPGTLSLSPQTLIAIISETGDWLVSSGVRRLFLISSHVTNFAPLRCGLEVLRAKHENLLIALLPTSEISPRVRDIFFADAEDWHANDAETSLMLALRPDLVRQDRLMISDDPDRTTGHCFAYPVNKTSENGVTGTPSHATAEKGHHLFAMMTEDLTRRITAAIHEEPPIT